LLKNADRSGLPQYIQSKPFTARVWLPPNFRVFHPPRPVVSEDVSKGQDIPASVADPDVIVDNSKAETPGEGSHLNTNLNGSTVLEDANASHSASAIIVDSRNVIPDAGDGNLLPTADHSDTVPNVGDETMPGVENGDSMPNVDKSIEVQPPNTTDARTSPPVGKKSRRAQEDANVQWLGDKVIDRTSSRWS
jgi:endoribonuclease Dicer